MIKLYLKTKQKTSTAGYRRKNLLSPSTSPLFCLHNKLLLTPAPVSTMMLRQFFNKSITSWRVLMCGSLSRGLGSTIMLMMIFHSFSSSHSEGISRSSPTYSRRTSCGFTPMDIWRWTQDIGPKEETGFIESGMINTHRTVFCFCNKNQVYTVYAQSAFLRHFHIIFKVLDYYYRLLLKTTLMLHK